MTRKKATIDQHATFALAITRIEREILELQQAARPYTSKKIATKLRSVLKCLDGYKARLDYLMYRDHPQLGDVWHKLYHGTADDVRDLLKAWESEHNTTEVKHVR